MSYWFEKYRPNNLHLIDIDQEVKKVFTPKPLISCRSARKLSSYLVRAGLYHSEIKVGLFKFEAKKFQTCLNVNETESFSSSVTKNEYKINHCNEKTITKNA